MKTISIEANQKAINRVAQEERMLTSIDIRHLYNVIKELPTKQAYSLIMVYLEGHTYTYVAKSMGVTKSCIDALCSKALRALRHPAKLNKLKELVVDTDMDRGDLEFVRPEDRKYKAKLKPKRTITRYQLIMNMYKEGVPKKQWLKRIADAIEEGTCVDTSRR